MRISCAVFDFDGTLFDSMFIWDNAGELYLLSQGRKPAPGLREDLRTMSLSQSAAFLRSEYGLPLTEREIIDGINAAVEGFYFNDVLPKPGARELLDGFRKAGIPMCIATATDRPQIEAALKRCGLDRFFDEIFTCSEAGHGKDEPHIFRRAMERFGADRASTLVFEDALHAARTAADDGFTVIGVFDPSEKQQDELKALSAVYMEDLRHTEELWKFLSA